MPRSRNGAGSRAPNVKREDGGPFLEHDLERASGRYGGANRLTPNGAAGRGAHLADRFAQFVRRDRRAGDRPERARLETAAASAGGGSFAIGAWTIHTAREQRHAATSL